MSAVNLSIKGGGKFSSHLSSIGKAARTANTVKVGFLAGADYPDGLTVAQVAFWNEFGTINQVPRPFFRRMIAKNSRAWGGVLAKQLQGSNYDAAKSLALLGNVVKDQLITSINEFSDPPLKPSTIKRKGFSKPLIDTSTMLDAPSYEVLK